MRAITPRSAEVGRSEAPQVGRSAGRNEAVVDTVEISGVIHVLLDVYLAEAPTVEVNREVALVTVGCVERGSHPYVEDLG